MESICSKKKGFERSDTLETHYDYWKVVLRIVAAVVAYPKSDEKSFVWFLQIGQRLWYTSELIVHLRVRKTYFTH